MRYACRDCHKLHDLLIDRLCALCASIRAALGVDATLIKCRGVCGQYLKPSQLAHGDRCDRCDKLMYDAEAMMRGAEEELGR